MKWSAVFMSTVAVALMASCGNSSQNNEREGAVTEVTGDHEAPAVNLGKIAYDETEFNFGTITEGEVVDHVFKFKNTGDAPVILSQVTASCGCTTPNYTREPVLPGEEGEIMVSFDSQGQVGVQQKIISVMSNAENRVTTVQIRGTVNKK